MDLTQGARDGGAPAPQRTIVTGYVSRSQPAPAAFSDPLYVVLPSLSPTYNYGPCRWAAEQGATLPAQGAEALVAFDDNGAPVVIWWEGPYTADPDAVRGQVASGGTIDIGTGFTVTKNGTGDYSVAFTAAFPTTPVVVVTTGNSGTATAARLHTATAPSASGFRVFTYIAVSVTAADNSFTFIAEAA